jgi:hypothetical protein
MFGATHYIKCAKTLQELALSVASIIPISSRQLWPNFLFLDLQWILRLQMSRLITVDHFLSTKKKRFASPSESYILILICHSTKAVYAEIVKELNITLTLAAIYRFFSRRGPPKSILSDSASPFVSIKKAIKGQTSSRSILTDWNALKGREWRLTTGNLPHMIRSAELCVKSLKKSLTISIGMQRITYDELHTIVSQVECMLNSRPLVLNVRNDDINPITPAMLLTGKNMLPSGISLPHENTNYQSIRGRLVENITESFRDRWKSIYLSSLIARKQWQQSKRVTTGTL